MSTTIKLVEKKKQYKKRIRSTSKVFLVGHPSSIISSYKQTGFPIFFMFQNDAKEQGLVGNQDLKEKIVALKFNTLIILQLNIIVQWGCPTFYPLWAKFLSACLLWAAIGEVN